MGSGTDWPALRVRVPAAPAPQLKYPAGTHPGMRRTGDCLSLTLSPLTFTFYLTGVETEALRWERPPRRLAGASNTLPKGSSRLEQVPGPLWEPCSGLADSRSRVIEHQNCKDLGKSSSATPLIPPEDSQGNRDPRRSMGLPEVTPRRAATGIQVSLSSSGCLLFTNTACLLQRT